MPSHCHSHFFFISQTLTFHSLNCLPSSPCVRFLKSKLWALEKSNSKRSCSFFVLKMCCLNFLFLVPKLQPKYCVFSNPQFLVSIYETESPNLICCSKMKTQIPNLDFENQKWKIQSRALQRKWGWSLILVLRFRLWCRWRISIVAAWTSGESEETFGGFIDQVLRKVLTFFLFHLCLDNVQ